MNLIFTILTTTPSTIDGNMTTIIVAVISALSSLVVAWMSVTNKNSQRKTEKYLQEQVEVRLGREEEDRVRNEKLEKISSGVTDIKKDILDIKEDLKTIRTDVDDVIEDVKDKSKSLDKTSIISTDAMSLTRTIADGVCEISEVVSTTTENHVISNKLNKTADGIKTKSAELTDKHIKL